MVDVVLFEPEIPPNTGNIIRLCANAGARLHLVEPLGFKLDDKKLKRAGLDYHDWASLSIHADFASLKQALAPNTRLLACTTKATRPYTEINFQAGDALLFGPETRGLPLALLNSLPSSQLLRIPMAPNNRSLNLSNAVAIVLFEAWRQLGFVGGS